MVTFTPGITVVIPTIPPRNDLFNRAVISVHHAAQNMPRGVPVQIEAERDDDRQGAAATRHAGLSRVRTRWTAFLDDDDTMDPHHLLELYKGAQEHGADYVWSRFRIRYPGGRTSPGPAPLGQGSFEQWNDDQPAQTTITTLVRTELAQDVGGFLQCDCVECNAGRPQECTTVPIDGQRAGEDWLFTLACRAAGGTFLHVPKVTWSWHHHGANTSGLPDRW